MSRAAANAMDSFIMRCSNFVGNRLPRDRACYEATRVTMCKIALASSLKSSAVMPRTIVLLGYTLLLVGCENFPAPSPVINSGSYDWTDQVRDARGFPLLGWGSVIMPGGGAGQR
jgi:hypothetical protein